MKGNVQQKIYRLFRIGEIKEGLLSWIQTATFSLDAVGYGIYQCLCEETVKTQITCLLYTSDAADDCWSV